MLRSVDIINHFRYANKQIRNRYGKKATLDDNRLDGPCKLFLTTLPQDHLVKAGGKVYL